MRTSEEKMNFDKWCGVLDTEDPRDFQIAINELCQAIEYAYKRENVSVREGD